MSYNDIASNLSIPIGTAKAQIYRAKDILFRLNETKNMGKLGNYPYFNTLFSIVIAIFLTGVLSVFSIQVQKLATLFHTNLEIQLFLDKDLSQEVINNLENSAFPKTLSCNQY